MSWAYQPLLPAAAQLQSGGGASTLTAASGSFTLSGQAAALTRALTLTAAQGSFVLSGQAVTLQVGVDLTAAQGSFTLSGQSVGLTAARQLTASQGSFTLSGQNALATLARILAADPGSISFSGQAAQILPSALIFPAETGTVALTGISTTLRTGEGGDCTTLNLGISIGL